MAAYQLHETSSLDEAQAASASRIFRGVRRIDRLVSDLAVLVHSRVGSPLPLTKTKADLGRICEQALEEVRASHGDVVFEVRKGGDLSGNWDGERLARVGWTS
jgi:signal transduction histidine kinase